MRIKRHFFTLALCAGVAPLSFGYVREFDNGIPLAWVKDRTVVMQLSLTGTRTLRDGFASFNDSAIDALKTWNSHLAHLQFSWVKNSPVVPRDLDDEMSVFFSDKLFDTNFGPGVLAVTVLDFRNGNFEETDTLFNTAYAWDSYRGPLTPPVYDFHRVAIHEFGHTLGLDHPDQYGQNVVAIMNSRVSNLDTLAQDDINGVRSIYGTGLAYDFNRDSEPDYTLYNTGTRRTAVWYLNNNVFTGGAYGPTLPPNWKIVGVADFDGDGKPDYMLFNSSTHQTAIWYLSGTSFVGGAYGPRLPNGWDLVAVGDFNVDSNPDYVLYAPATGQTAIWYLNNNVLTGGAYGPTLPPNWRVVGVADFNGDNEPDYLLINSSTSQTAIWYLSGATFISGAYGPTIVSGYSLIGAADFDRDGKPDYALYNSTTQQTAIWYLNNNASISGAYGPNLPGGWSLVAP